MAWSCWLLDLVNCLTPLNQWVEKPLCLHSCCYLCICLYLFCWSPCCHLYCILCISLCLGLGLYYRLSYIRIYIPCHIDDSKIKLSFYFYPMNLKWKNYYQTFWNWKYSSPNFQYMIPLNDVMDLNQVNIGHHNIYDANYAFVSIKAC